VRHTVSVPAAVLQKAGAWLDALLAARGALMPWAAVMFAAGIGGYFALPVEPGGVPLALLGGGLAVLLLAALRGPERAIVPCLGLALVGAGLLSASLRAHLVAAPVLGFRYYGPVEGRIIDIDRSYSDRIRLTLDRVRLEDVTRSRTPARVRIALHGDQAGFRPEPGMTVMLTGHLAPPDGPVEPGGFDFQRLAWFQRLGAVGYTRTPVMVLARAEGGGALLAFRARMALSAAMQQRMEGQAGAFAAALMTGDRSGVDAATNEALRASNLSHMISISGLHMGLLAGFVLGLVRYGIALVPPAANRWNAKKIAAGAALLAATAYMILAGPDVATRRAYIMVTVMLIAVLADRRAVTLRSVAIAAIICLALEPESLIEPGFQMSFAATAALVVGFDLWTRVQNRVPAFLRPAAAMVVSSLIAGAATAPFAAAHFNRIAEYGLLANLLAVPVMGLVVMPAGVMAALLAPLGLAGIALWAMERGCALVLWIGERIAALEGSVRLVPAPPGSVLPILGLAGALILAARPAGLRLAGLAALILAAAVWASADRPDLLVSGDGTLAGLMTPAGRALSKPKGAGFVADNWLENDGDVADQITASARPGFTGTAKDRAAWVGSSQVLIFAG
jgi:competence protein ComEC